MKKLEKWSPVVLIWILALVLALVIMKIDWNVKLKECTGPPPYFKQQTDDFLSGILNRIVQGVSNNNDHYFTIKSVFNSLFEIRNYRCFVYWAAIDTSEEEIFINKRLILLAKNEAELAYVIAHEIGHVVALEMLPKSLWPGSYEINKRFDYLPSYIMIHYPPYNKFLKRFNQERAHTLIDRVGIELMSKANYNTYSAVNILQKLAYEKIRLDVIRQNAQKHYRRDQEKWILFIQEDLEKIKKICRKFGEQNGE